MHPWLVLVKASFRHFRRSLLGAADTSAGLLACVPLFLVMYAWAASILVVLLKTVLKHVDPMAIQAPLSSGLSLAWIVACASGALIRVRLRPAFSWYLLVQPVHRSTLALGWGMPRFACGAAAIAALLAPVIFGWGSARGFSLGLMLFALALMIAFFGSALLLGAAGCGLVQAAGMRLLPRPARAWLPPALAMLIVAGCALLVRSVQRSDGSGLNPLTAVPWLDSTAPIRLLPIALALLCGSAGALWIASHVERAPNLAHAHPRPSKRPWHLPREGWRISCALDLRLWRRAEDGLASALTAQSVWLGVIFWQLHTSSPAQGSSRPTDFDAFFVLASFVLPLSWAAQAMLAYGLTYRGLAQILSSPLARADLIRGKFIAALGFCLVQWATTVVLLGAVLGVGFVPPALGLTTATFVAFVAAAFAAGTLLPVDPSLPSARERSLQSAILALAFIAGALLLMYLPVWWMQRSISKSLVQIALAYALSVYFLGSMVKPELSSELPRRRSHGSAT